VEALDILACQLAATLQRSRARHEATYLSGYLSRLLDHANVPIAVLDRHRRIQVASQAMLELVGLSRGELVGRDLMHHVRDGHRAALRDAIASALRGASAGESFEVTVVGAQTRDVRMLTNLVPVRSPEGTLDGVLVIGRDVTELRALESQVLQAEKLATLGQLAAGVVHELNNPLTSISVYADYLHAKWTRENAAVEDREKLQRIRQAAERVVRFSRDLVTYARPSHEAPSALDVREVVEQSLAFCEHVIADAGALVERRFARHDARVLAVRSQLHQVLINLVTNACHAMPQGAGRLVLETEERGGHVVVRVIDNGAGISPDHLAQIFEPFFSTKGEGQGTGLGLSIAKKIVEHHGGELRVESLLGAGTTFEVVVPIHH
jgi:PAS domain S-box-containing protein